MNVPSPPQSVRICPSCKAAVNDRALSCSSCGGVLLVENVLSRVRWESRHLMQRLSEKLRDKATLIWVLVLIPLLIVPPAFGIFLALRARASGPDKVFADGTARSLAIMLGVCNIVLTILFWRWLGSFAFSFGFSIGALLKSLGVNPSTVSGGGSI